MTRNFDFEAKLPGFDFYPLVQATVELGYRGGQMEVVEVRFREVLGHGDRKMSHILEPRHWTAITEQALDFAYENVHHFEAELEAM